MRKVNEMTFDILLDQRTTARWKLSVDRIAARRSCKEVVLKARKSAIVSALKARYLEARDKFIMLKGRNGRIMIGVNRDYLILSETHRHNHRSAKRNAKYTWASKELRRWRLDNHS